MLMNLKKRKAGIQINNGLSMKKKDLKHLLSVSNKKDMASP